MNHINVTINGRRYRMACEDGQETRLMRLAETCRPGWRICAENSARSAISGSP